MFAIQIGQSVNDSHIAFPARPDGARRCVLIVDDDPVFALLASETLLQGGFDVAVAGSTTEALALIATRTPDLLLLDVDLPGGDGYGLCAELRLRPGGAEVPIVMVTGHDDTESIARAYEAGATDFIHKPVLWPTLPHRVGFILRAQDSKLALQASEQKNRALLQALPDAILIIGADGSVREHIHGSDGGTSEDFVGRTLEQVFPPEVAQAARLALGGTPDPDIGAQEFNVAEEGGRRWLEVRLRPQADGPLLIVMRDSTERRRAKARIEFLAHYDLLTRLPKRPLFVREAQRAMRQAVAGGKALALLHLNLDRFKRVNDTFGHAVGDTLLQHVARRLEKSVRPTDVVAKSAKQPTAPRVSIARVGGDEFVVLLTELADESQAGQVTERIQKLLGEPFDCAGHHIVITSSIGIAMYPRDTSDVDDLLTKADIAMQQAKEQGRNRLSFFGETMALRSLGRLEMEVDLRDGIDRGEFQLYYQPKLELQSDTVVGVEALLRWNHPTRGAIAPDTFIPVAEDAGLIIDLGNWVIGEACRQIKAWEGTPLQALRIAVNVSVQQFAHPDFVESLLNTVRHYGVPPQQLELEITESLLMRNVEATRSCLERFRSAGIAISIDDFGTGYSSLGYLRQFPVDSLKIDRSFVKDVHTRDDDSAICAAIIAIGRELRLKVIAEGVETVEQLEFLRKHRCDQSQGYLISAPLPITELQALLQTRRVAGA